ncbi:MAG: hypothetical protein HC919_02585 [Oscillatoriales cyanobacterium SM2_2_1]|nr:hypothetical protein [Oscillatoriales cyanobacterium SM2_2_1]
MENAERHGEFLDLLSQAQEQLKYSLKVIAQRDQTIQQLEQTVAELRDCLRSQQNQNLQLKRVIERRLESQEQPPVVVEESSSPWAVAKLAADLPPAVPLPVATSPLEKVVKIMPCTDPSPDESDGGSTSPGCYPYQSDHGSGLLLPRVVAPKFLRLIGETDPQLVPIKAMDSDARKELEAISVAIAQRRKSVHSLAAVQLPQFPPLRQSP